MASKPSVNDDNEEPIIFTNYKPTLHKRFAEMFHRKELTDAILICENQRIHVHKFLLSASSSFFDKMFKKPHAHSLYINNIKYADLITNLEYIYKGEVSLPHNRIIAFLETADKLSVSINSNDVEAATLKYGLKFESSSPNDDDLVAGRFCVMHRVCNLGESRAKKDLFFQKVGVPHFPDSPTKIFLFLYLKRLDARLFPDAIHASLLSM